MKKEVNKVASDTAQEFLTESIKRFIDCEKHYILECAHPSPLSANRGGWFGNKHFSKCNALLKEMGKTEIDWKLN